LNIWVGFRINNTAVDLSSLLLKLFSKRVLGVVMNHLLVITTNIMVVLWILWGPCITFIIVTAIVLFVARLRKPRSVILHIELDPSQLDDISSAKLVVKIVLSRFSVPDHHKHLVVDILIRNGIAFKISWGLSHYGVVFNLKLA